MEKGIEGKEDDREREWRRVGNRGEMGRKSKNV